MTPAQIKALQWAVNRACSDAARKDAIANDKGRQHAVQAKAAREALKALTLEPRTVEHGPRAGVDTHRDVISRSLQADRARDNAFTGVGFSLDVAGSHFRVKRLQGEADRDFRIRIQAAIPKEAP